MRKQLIKIAALILGYAGSAHALYPPTQDMGSVQVSTSIARGASTLPSILLSTGANVGLGSAVGPGPTSISFASYTANTLQGQYMPDRVSLCIFNQSTHSIWIGYDANVTSYPSVYQGFRLYGTTTNITSVVTPGQIFQENGAIRDYYIVSDDTFTSRDIIIKQSK